MADIKSIITCPACDKEMTKIYVEDADTNVDVCLNGCGGIFFDNLELEKFDEKHENANVILEALAGKNYNSVDEREVRICPICNKSMVKTGSKAEDIQIDVCYSCGAKFLDNGELEKIREAKVNKTEAQRFVYVEENEEKMYRENLEEVIGTKRANEEIKKSWGRASTEKFVKFFMGIK